ncbi:hypothetical protein Tsp_07901 [Trichinella spiralis]|uniref:hypothetical protein n=1 Tax=Trichinella spiralis TaxID=6334 RepID=UPI0001EFB479|nr:hypothetical protein Tsp_07901 [Trichinella spiralis]
MLLLFDCQYFRYTFECTVLREVPCSVSVVYSCYICDEVIVNGIEWRGLEEYQSSDGFINEANCKSVSLHFHTITNLLLLLIVAALAVATFRAFFCCVRFTETTHIRCCLNYIHFAKSKIFIRRSAVIVTTICAILISALKLVQVDQALL